MPPISSRDFQTAAAQRLMAAKTLFHQTLTLDAQYLGGYVVECSLKALILDKTPDTEKDDTLKKIIKGAKMHDPEKLLELLWERGVKPPVDLRKRMARFVGTWATDLRYETGRRDTGETRAFLNTAEAVYDWVEASLS